MSKYCYIYVLRSVKDNQFYVGLTRDLPVRVRQHNNGLVTSTKKRIPFELVYLEGCINESDAAQRSNTSKAHGVSVTSKAGCDDISRGKESSGLTFANARRVRQHVRRVRYPKRVRRRERRGAA